MGGLMLPGPVLQGRLDNIAATLLGKAAIPTALTTAMAGPRPDPPPRAPPSTALNSQPLFPPHTSAHTRTTEHGAGEASAFAVALPGRRPCPSPILPPSIINSYLLPYSSS